MELAGYTLERLRVDSDFALYRGGRLGNADPILVLAPSREQQTLANAQRLEREISFARDLDPAWAVRPMRLIRQDERVILVLEDPGGDPLDAILGRPLEPTHFLRLAIGLTVALRHIHRARPHPQGHQAGECVVECGRMRPADGLRICLPGAAGTANADGAGDDRRDLCLYGAGTDRPHEPVDRCAQRPLCTGRHVL